MVDVFKFLLKPLVTALASEQLATSESFACLLAVLIAITDHGKELKLGFSLRRAEQLVLQIHALCYDGCRVFTFRLRNVVIERVLLVGRSRERDLWLWRFFVCRGICERKRCKTRCKKRFAKV